MKLNLEGRIRNVNSFLTTPLLPLFEAVVNSIQSIQESNNKHGYIHVTMHRSKQEVITFEDDTRPIQSISITDNGIGFTPTNFEAFTTSDTSYKHSIGGKGIGRFTWLKAFERVQISSCYVENGNTYRISFDFIPQHDGVLNRTVSQISGTAIETEVQLLDYKKEYQKRAPLKLTTIAEYLLEHCLDFFITNQAPDIIVRDDNGESINLKQLFSETVEFSPEKSVFDFGMHRFVLTHVYKYPRHDSKHELALLANNRVVEKHELKRFIIDLEAALINQDKEFWYSGYLESDYLNDNVNALRTEIFFDGSPALEVGIKRKELLQTASAKCKEYLEPHLKRVISSKEERVVSYIRNTAPQHSFLLDRIEEVLPEIKPSSSEEDIDLVLYTRRHSYSVDVIARAIKLNQSVGSPIDWERYKIEYKEVINQMTQINQFELVSYIMYRKHILDLATNIRQIQNSRYEAESALHNLVFPMGVTSRELGYDKHNLWMVDDRLSFHNFIASDKTLKSIKQIASDSTKEPDIIIFDDILAYVDSMDSYNCIILIEFKQPARDDYTLSKNPYSQLVNYINLIKGGSGKDHNGIPIEYRDGLYFHCYIICDKTPSFMETVILDKDFTITPDGLGAYQYHRTHRAYFEHLSYQKLLLDAAKRNKAFIDKLGQKISLERIMTAGFS